MKNFWRVIIALVVLIGMGAAYYFFRPDTISKPVVNDAEANNKEKKSEEVNQDELAPTATNVPQDKVWSFSFSEELNPSTVSTKNIKVKDEEEKEIPVQIQLTNVNKTIQITPPSGGYEKGVSYHLHIENGISYADGKPVSKPYDLDFIIERNKVEEGKLNPNLIMVKQEQINSKKGNVLKIDKDIKKNLKIGEIIIVPSTENEVGKALKIKTVKKGFKSYTITVTKPDFNELYEKLDVNNTYEINPNNIKLEKGLKGISLESVAQVEPNTEIASSNSPTPLEEYKLPKVEQSYSKSKGFEFALSNLELKDKDGTSVVLSGSVNVLNPKINVDTKITAGKLERMLFSYNTHIEDSVTAQLAGFEVKREKDLFSKTFKKRSTLDERIKIATVSIPVPYVPGLEVEGSFYLRFKASLSGTQEITITFEADDEKGISYYGKNTKPISSFNPNFDMTYLAKSVGESSFGPNLQFGLSALEVVGAGVEGFAGVKLNGKVNHEESLKKEDYICADAYIAGVAEAGMYIDAHIPLITDPNEHLVSYSLPEAEFFKKRFNTCNSLKKIIANKKTISLEASKEVNVEVLAKYLNLISQEYSSEKIDSHKELRVSVNDSNVVQVTKNKNNLKVKATDLPAKEKTSIKIEYQVMDKAYKKQRTASVTIPITIKNYAQVLKKKEELNSVNAWKGQWARNTSYAVGDMRITNVTSNSFDYEIHIVSAIYSGTAIIDGNTAIAPFEGTNCDTSFTLNKNSIEVFQDEKCKPAGDSSGSTIMSLQSGTYEKGAPTVEQDAQPGFFD